MSIEGTAKTEYASLSGKIHTFVVDKTLSVSGACADAKAVGDKIEPLEDCVKEAKELYEEAVSGMEEVAGEIAGKAAKEAVDALTAGDVGAYTKDEVATDVTKGLFGLGADAVPDDVFGVLSNLYKHFWARYSDVVSVVLSGFSSAYVVSQQSAQSTTTTVYYSDEVNLDDEATVLVNPQTLDLSYSAYTDANTLKGKYWYPANSTSFIRFTPADATDATREYSGGSYIVYVYAAQVTATIVRGAPEFISSTERNAYPDSGTVDGYSYAYLGVPFKNAVTALKIATGSYTGTGTYGESNPNSLTFDFEPKIIIFTGYFDGTYSANFSFDRTTGFIVDWSMLTGTYRNALGPFFNSRSGNVYTKKDGKTLYWYDNQQAAGMLNTSGYTYYYIAIG